VQKATRRRAENIVDKEYKTKKGVLLARSDGLEGAVII